MFLPVLEAYEEGAGVGTVRRGWSLHTVSLCPQELLTLLPKPVIRALRTADLPEPFLPTMKLT